MDKAKYLSVIAIAYRENGHLDKALRYFTDSLDMYRKLKAVNPRTHKDLLISIASLCQGLRRHQDAIKYLEEAMDWSTKQNCATADEPFELNAKIASIAERCQDYERALKAYQSIHETIHAYDSSVAAGNLRNIGHCYLNLKDYENAAEYFTISLELYQETDQHNYKEIAYTLLCLGRALIGAGDFSSSLKYLTKAQALRARVDIDWNPELDGIVCEAIAESYMRLGNATMALEHFRMALESIHSDQARARVYYQMGETCALLEDDLSSAIQFYSKSLDFQKQGPMGQDRVLFIDTNMSLARLYIVQQDFEQSLKHLTAVVQQEPSESLSSQFDLSALMSFCHIQLDLLAPAEFYSDCALQILHSMPSHEFENMDTVKSLLRLAKAWKSAGRDKTSLEFYRLLSSKFSSLLDNQAIFVEILQSTAELYKSLGDLSSYTKFTDLAILHAELQRTKS